MNPSKEIRRKQRPAFFISESQWFAEGFLQPNTKREILEVLIDAFQTLIWDQPLDDLLPAYGKYFPFLVSYQTFVISALVES